MKRIIGLAIAVVMLVALVTVFPAFAYTDEENVALGKPVFVVSNGAAPAADAYWRPEFLTDGLAQDTTDGNALGWAFGTLRSAGLNIDVRAYIDLGAVYSVSSIVVVPMQWVPTATFPGTYEIYLSADGSEWTKVAEAAPRTESTGGNDIYEFDPVEAAFVCFKVTSHSGAWADDLTYYSGYGELEVHGAKVKDTDKKFHAYANYSGDLVTAPPFSAEEALGAPTVWTGHTSGSLKWQMAFKSDVSFWAVNFPVSWCAAGCPLKVTIAKDGHFDDGIVFTKDIVRSGDGAFCVAFDEPLPAGQYVIKFKIADDTLAAEGQYAFYNVLGHAKDMLGKDYCLNTNGTPVEGMAAMQLISCDDGQGFVKRDVVTRVNIDGATAGGVDLKKDGSLNEVPEGTTAMSFNGWVASNYAIEKFGYQIDSGEIVYNESFKRVEEDADFNAIMGVAANFFGFAENGTGYRFVTENGIPLSKGTHTVKLYARMNDQDVEFTRFKIANGEDDAGTVNPPETNAKTGDVSVAMIAIFAVLAMGAAVVFARKKSF